MKNVDQVFLEKYLQRTSLQEELTRAEKANKATKDPDYKNIILKLLSVDFQKTRVLS